MYQENRINTFSDNNTLQSRYMSNEEPFRICEHGRNLPYRFTQDNRCIPSGTHVEYILSGRGTISTRDHSCIVHAGDTVILPQGIPYRYHSDPKAPIRKIWITVSGELVFKMMKLYHLDGSIFFQGVDSSSYLSRMITICEETEEPYVQKEKVGGVFCELLHFLNRQQRIASSAKGDRLDEVREYIHLHMRDSISIENLCEISQATPNHTIRMFKQKFGITPHQYYLKLKLEVACTLLCAETVSVETIAEQLGFCSTAHFSEAFYKYQGVRPAQYRKMHRSVEPIVSMTNLMPLKNAVPI